MADKRSSAAVATPTMTNNNKLPPQAQQQAKNAKPQITTVAPPKPGLKYRCLDFYSSMDAAEDSGNLKSDTIAAIKGTLGDVMAAQSERKSVKKIILVALSQVYTILTHTSVRSVIFLIFLGIIGGFVGITTDLVSARLVEGTYNKHKVYLYCSNYFINYYYS